MNITIRPAAERDADAIWRVNKASLGYDYPVERTRENVRYVLSRPMYRVFVACDENGDVLGYAHAADYDNTYSDRLKNLMGLAVLDSAQGLGIGRMLLRAVETWAREDGCAGVRLVSGHNRTPAHQFYFHCGYVLRKEQKNLIKLFDAPAQARLESSARTHNG